MRRFWVIGLLFALCCEVSLANTVIHVSANGNDAAAGSPSAPIRSITEAQKRWRQALKTGKVEVVLHEGRYQPLSLTTVDSGKPSAPLSIRGMGKVVISGAAPIEARQLPPASDDVLNRLPTNAKSKVRALQWSDVSKQKISPWRNRQNDNGGFPSILAANGRLPLARWPNDDTTTMARVNEVGQGQGAARKLPNFTYRDDRHANWPTDKGVWIRGYFRVPWQLDTVRLQSIDSTNKTATLSELLPGGLGSKYHRPHGSGKEPYWVVNQLEELDQPGEWCFDVDSQKVYIWPPDENGVLEVYHRKDPALNAADASHVKISGLIFEGSKGAGVVVRGGRDVHFDACEVRNVGGWGIELRGGFQHRVTNSKLHHLGGGGVRMEGGNRDTLEPARHEVRNCEIHHYGEIQKVYSAGINAGHRFTAVGMIVRDNRIHHAPHAGILYGGNKNKFTGNEIFQVCLVSNDMGGLYTWHDWTSFGNEIRFNFVHSSPNAHGVYADDGDSGDLIEKNLFWGIDTGVFIGGGHGNVIRQNVAVNCKTGLHLDARGLSRGYVMTNDRLAKSWRRYTALELWRQTYPKLLDIENHPQLPSNNLFESNLAIACKRATNFQVKPEQLGGTHFADNQSIESEGYENLEALKQGIAKHPLPWTAAEHRRIPATAP